MKNQGVFKLAVFGVLVGMMLSMIVGCGGGGDSSGNGNGDGNGNGNGDATALSMMKKVPASATSFDFVDYGSFRADDDLRGAYSDANDRYNDELADLGILAVDVDYMTRAERWLPPNSPSSLVILEGTFNLHDLNGELKDKDYYHEDDYKGVQTWAAVLHHSVALVSASCVVYGNNIDVVEDCLDVIKGGADSLYDNADLRDVVAKLPTGVLVLGDLGDQVVGESVIKKNADTLRLTAVYLSKDEAEAAALKSWYEAAIAADPDSFKNPEVSQNGKYVTVAGDAAIEDFNWPGNAQNRLDTGFPTLYPFSPRWSHGGVIGLWGNGELLTFSEECGSLRVPSGHPRGQMPFISAIIAKLLALQDWFLSQFVSVGLVASASPNGCWAFDIVNASVNPCGQEFIRNHVVEEWVDLLQATTILIPSLFAF